MGVRLPQEKKTRPGDLELRPHGWEQQTQSEVSPPSLSLSFPTAQGRPHGHASFLVLRGPALGLMLYCLPERLLFELVFVTEA